MNGQLNFVVPLPERMINTEKARVQMDLFKCILRFLPRCLDSIENNHDRESRRVALTELTWLFDTLYAELLDIAELIGAENIPLIETGVEPDQFETENRNIRVVAYEIIEITTLLDNMIELKLQKQRQVIQTVHDLPMFSVRGEVVEGVCSICIEGFVVGQHLVTLPCQHNFHPECVFPWLLENPSCPVDRTSIME